MDPFEEGFRAGYQRGAAYGRRDVIYAVQRALPEADSRYLGSVDSQAIDHGLRECLLEREARRRSEPDQRPIEIH